MRANKLETALSRDRLACLTPPDMVFSSCCIHCGTEGACVSSHECIHVSLFELLSTCGVTNSVDPVSQVRERH